MNVVKNKRENPWPKDWERARETKDVGESSSARIDIGVLRVNLTHGYNETDGWAMMAAENY